MVTLPRLLSASLLTIGLLALSVPLASAQVLPSEDLDCTTSPQEISLRPRSVELLRDQRKLWQTVSRLLRDDLPTGHSDRVEHAFALMTKLTAVRDSVRLLPSKTLKKAELLLVARLRRIEKQTTADLRRRKRKPERIEIRKDVLAQLNDAAVNPALGAGRAANQANGNLAGQDYGPLLVSLIQRTISPQSWDVNGGRSSIQYWRPGRALVVRAPQYVHSELSPLLLQLRK